MSQPLSYDRPQFRLRSLMLLITLLCVVFAVLGALGVSPLHALVGFAVLTGVALVQVLCIEAIYQATGLRRRPALRPLRDAFRDFLGL